MRLVVRFSAAGKAAIARERVEHIKRGADVPGGLGKPMTREDYNA
jgi:hypothetical protein